MNHPTVITVMGLILLAAGGSPAAQAPPLPTVVPHPPTFDRFTRPPLDHTSTVTHSRKITTLAGERSPAGNSPLGECTPP